MADIRLLYFPDQDIWINPAYIVAVIDAFDSSASDPQYNVVMASGYEFQLTGPDYNIMWAFLSRHEDREA